MGSAPGPLRIHLTPAQILAMGFAAVILTGALLLMLPVSSVEHKVTPFIDALFTATSATCVTGLVVVDTGTYYSFFGQVVIIALIQIGGLGIMTMASLFALALGRRIRFRERLLMQEAIGQQNVAGIVRLTKRILLFTFAIEGTGALILTLRWLRDLPPGKAVWFGAFHAISAFCNAGFDLWTTSLARFVADPTVTLTISSLIILGGLGFYVLADLWDVAHHRGHPNLHTRVVVRTTAILLVVGTALLLVFEASNPATMGPLTWTGKLLASWFQSVTTRTAGYFSVSIGGLTRQSLFLMVILMFIGASPGSTGGGIKTTTFTTLILAVWATIRGKSDVEVFQRRLARDVIDKALVISMLSLVLLVSGVLILSATQPFDFLSLLFEATSAFATVGLSTGITPELSAVGKVIDILLMYAGRVGPLTLAMAITIRKNDGNIHLPEDRVVIG